MRSLPCVHVGQMLSRQIDEQRRFVTVRACALHGSCSLERPIEGATVCDECRDYEANAELLIAPLNGFPDNRAAGRTAKKSIRYRVTLILPHLETPELLAPAVELWRLQTERPYIVVIDTGSSRETCATLEKLRAEDLEIHYIRRHFWHNSSAPVAAALDLGHALADTPYILHSHVDLFPRRRDLLATLLLELQNLCGNPPIIGWEMSSRDHVPGVGDQWRGMVSHTCTLLHRRAIQDSGARWSLVAAYDNLDWWTKPASGWPDTETDFNFGLRKAGIVPKLLGAETNDPRQLTEWWDHARSYTAKKMCGRLNDVVECAAALSEAKERVERWQKDDGDNDRSGAGGDCSSTAAQIPPGNGDVGRASVASGSL